ncbi:MAG: lantibiotic dehydratase family protein, partial [Acidobacteriota bacterium]
MKRTLDFEPTGFFAFRTPLLPWEELTAWNEGLRASAAHADAGDVADALAADRQLLRQRLVELIERPEIREALFVAAPALDIGVEAWRRDAESKKGRRAEESLVRYFLRMTTRPTPFGLFSGCSVGSLGESTRLDLVERGDYQRHTRLDTDYLFALCGVLGQDDEIRRLLRYRPNTSLYHAAGRLRYAESRLHGRTRVHHLVAVDVDDYLDLTLRRAANGAALEDLAGALVAADPDGEIEQDEAEEYVGELIDAQVLLSDLSPVVTGSESIHDLLDQLGELPAAASVQAGLAAARDALATLDDAGLGNEPESYRAVATGLEELPAKVDLPRLFQVDMTKPAPEALLGPKVIEEIERGLAILQRLDESPREDAFSQFRDNFIERYGDARRVPLFSVLDEEVGIGYSGSQSSDASPLLAGLRLPGVPQDRTIGWGPRTEMLFEKLEQALASGAHEITLSKKDLAKLESREGRPLPDGFQVMAAVAAESAEAIDRGDFQLHLRSAYGPSGAQLLGRFCHADETLQQRVEEHLRREEAMRPEAIFAEIVHLPEGRIGNILARPVLRQHEIPFLGRSGADAEHQIPVKDLLVSVVGQEIQLYSARLGRRVFPRMATAHNYSSRSLGVYRFLCSLQMQGLTSNLMWSWGGLDSAAFLPRVRSGRLVLSRARWKITRDEIRKLADKQDAARFEAVQAWRSRRRLPGRVVLQDGDNELLVDLDNILSIDTFLAVVKNRPSCTLAELFPDPEQLCIGSTEGRFVHEIVVPFLRRAPQQPQGEKIQPRSAAEPQQATAPQGEAAAAPTPP